MTNPRIKFIEASRQYDYYYDDNDNDDVHNEGTALEFHSNPKMMNVNKND